MSVERIVAIDLARSAALLGMAIYHFTRDLEMFGLVTPGLSVTPPWMWFARIVAGTFVLLAGVSLVLAHGDGIRWRPFRRRLVQIAAGAALVSAATYAAFPQYFIYFGILHSLALASLVCLPFVRWRPVAALAAAAAVFAIHRLWGWELFATPWLGWTGLSGVIRPTYDLIPVFPWWGVMLAGVALGKLIPWNRLRGRSNALPRALAWPGRHSLAVYLIHQPVLIALLWLVLRLTG